MDIFIFYSKCPKSVNIYPKVSTRWMGISRRRFFVVSLWFLFSSSYSSNTWGTFFFFLIYVGVAEPKIGSAIQDGLGLPCNSNETIGEFLRGIRLHFNHYIGDQVSSTGANIERAQLGLAHSYSRAKVKFNVNKSDNMIIQTIALLDQLDKDLNTLAMRVREWYSWHFPELSKLVKDNTMYARAAKLIGNRTSLDEESLPALTEVTMDEDVSTAILEAARTSMGMDINELDLMNIEQFVDRVVTLSKLRHNLSEYLHNKMNVVAPNLAALIGDTVGARLISHAGSLTNLAKAPASTVQILGAEKALFRALKTKGNTPKYGLIFHSSFIGRAEAKNKGRISRYLANKCSIASRIDSFSEVTTTKFGEKLRDQVEERLNFYETGATTKRNADVMRSVVQALKAENGEDEDNMETTATTLSSSKKQKKDKKEKKAKRSAENMDEDNEEDNNQDKKKKKKKHHRDDDDDSDI